MISSLDNCAIFVQKKNAILYNSHVIMIRLLYYSCYDYQ